MKKSTIIISLIIALAVGVGVWYSLGSGSDDHHVDVNHAAMDGAEAMH